MVEMFGALLGSSPLNGEQNLLSIQYF